MQITKDTRVSEILLKYGDIADVMKIFGVKPWGSIPCVCFSQRH